MSFGLVLGFILLFIFVRLLLSMIRKHKSGSWALQSDKRFFQTSVIAPTSLVPSGHPCEALARRLEQALPNDYAHQLRQRVLTEYPQMTPEEWNWRWVEMRRYFLICALFRQMPMFSDKIDVVWHEMLMFTREYQQFCDRFYGYMLHHAPNSTSVAQPDQRALFDWTYSQLFPITRPNYRLWNGFFNYPLSRSTMNRLYSFNKHRIDKRIFNTATFNHSTEARAGIIYLSQQFRDHNQQSLLKTPPDRSKKENSSDNYDSSSSANDNYGLGTSGCAAVYYSYNAPQHFCPAVNQHLPVDVQIQQHSSFTNSGSACGTGYISTEQGSGSSGNHHYGSDSYDSSSSHSHSGHDSSGSSCSSDSSSSSCSSCGGGGD